MGPTPAFLVLLGAMWTCLLSAAPQAFPAPSISLIPSGSIIPGTNMIIRCWADLSGMRFLLYKVGVLDALRHVEPAGNKGEFPITNARQEDSGNYTCRYQTLDEPPKWSYHSNPVELVVKGEILCSLESRHPSSQPHSPSGTGIGP
ncbi:hypothetical protein Y1Q_0011010 [Alligator mississippiensis]|uniref:Immunoglobulin domain-containing protein n=1 Tax=Alligator mississippiensis TaxID=8496 RepID=A0A151LYA2_ALLMI|nr:hypothetical protein Y1Q_0011010 [Alligator mississippiensis]